MWIGGVAWILESILLADLIFNASPNFSEPEPIACRSKGNGYDRVDARSFWA